MSEASEFTTDAEIERRTEDSLDRVRAEVNLYLRRYHRRFLANIKTKVKAEFLRDPNADPDEVAHDVLRKATQGMIGLDSTPRGELDEATATD